jgi:hypothetical protein
VNQQQSLPEAN